MDTGMALEVNAKKNTLFTKGIFLVKQVCKIWFCNYWLSIGLGKLTLLF